MWLIDADSVRDDFVSAVYANCTIDSNNDRANCIIDAFDDLPTIEAEPVKHGEWCGSVCSACGSSVYFYYDCDYCPSCGAKMDGGEK